MNQARDNNSHPYPPESAGRLMITHVPKILQTKTLGEIDSMLRHDLFATINYIYVVNSEDELIGVVTIKDLFRHPPQTKAKEVMQTNLITVRAHTDREKAALLALHKNIKAIPVVDKENKIIGLLDSDTLLKILDSEAFEDILSLGGIVNTARAKLTNQSLSGSITSRAPWLVIGLLGGLASAGVIGKFEETLERNIIIAAFIPVVVYVASAIGNQLVVLLIRDYSRNENLKLSSYFAKQFPVVVALAAICSVITTVLSLLLYGYQEVSAVLGIAVFLASISSIFSGLLIPGFFHRIKIDPATASGPIATIFQDLTTVIIYLVVASMIIA